MYGIGFVNSMRGWGGAEVWMLGTALALKDLGVNVSLAAQPGSELLRRARAAGLPVSAIPIRFDGAPWTWIKLARHFRRHRTTALVANLTKDLKAAAVAGRLAGVRHILGSRESDFPLKDKAYYRWYFAGLGTGLLVNSEATRRTVLASASWLDPERVHLLYKGIDTGRFAPAGPPPGNGTVGFAGQFIPRKGLATLMEAWAAIEGRDHSPARRLFLVGDGPLRAELETWRRSLRRPAAVEIGGLCEDMPGFYRRLDVLAVPSLAEGFGLVAAEAAACGVPVVAARASSLPEVIPHDEAGLLVPAGDADALADALEAVTGDESLARRLGDGGRRRVRRLFDQRETLRRLLALTDGPVAAVPEDEA